MTRLVLGAVSTSKQLGVSDSCSQGHVHYVIVCKSCMGYIGGLFETTNNNYMAMNCKLFNDRCLSG